jgi:hypothetical protein
MQFCTRMTLCCAKCVDKLGECWFSIPAQNAMPDIDHDEDDEDDEDVDDELHVDAREPPGDAAGEDAVVDARIFTLRLNCSVPGKYPFYCDNIQGVTRLVRGRYSGQQQAQSIHNNVDVQSLIYATQIVFPSNSFLLTSLHLQLLFTLCL